MEKFSLYLSKNKMALHTAIELPVVFYMEGQEEDYEFGSLSEHYFLWNFIDISSYGRTVYHECANGTMIVSDGVEYFTYYNVETVEGLIATAKHNELLSNSLMFNYN